MLDADALALVRACLAAVAPEADLDRIAGDASLRDELELDSIDVLALAAEITRRTGCDLPERDYPALATLDGAAALVAQRCRDR